MFTRYTHTPLEAGVAHITDLVAPQFTGHVGPVRFVRGHAETDDPDLVDYFRADPDRYAVTDTDEPAEDAEGHDDEQDDDPQE